MTPMASQLMAPLRHRLVHYGTVAKFFCVEYLSYAIRGLTFRVPIFAQKSAKRLSVTRNGAQYSIEIRTMF